ncbi:hypothetical protein [Shewanella sp. SG41-3]|uniref:hypothetical protein n=1 Tax=Shewanella sp. SG41-3 TaxID=2760977 RepID=UPI0016034F41|nr:hypothetical protein [Shewanella sp. SG41-3]MBB1477621.1 hypothetical protein [Shewanella sp. SG41-3]
MLHKIEKWIDQINVEYKQQRICCAKFFSEFEGFYPLAFLEQAYFVVVDEIPKPDFPELRQMGFSSFMDMQAGGITYKDTYYVLRHNVSSLRLHFHELVHVAQWAHLGAHGFILRYMDEIQTFGYHESPLEKMAYALDANFSEGGAKINIPSYVVRNI